MHHRSRPVAAIALVCAIVAGPAAHAATPAALASDLGLVLASETTCGLSFDQAAIGSFIEANVGADDLEFPARLKNAILFNQNTSGTLTDSQRTALCAQVGRLAETYGFTS